MICYLPTSGPLKGDEQTCQDAHVRVTPPTILVVDDDENIRLIIEMILTDEGYRVVTATGGEEIFRLLSARDVDLILMDLWLQGDDGRDLTRQLKSEPATCQIPVVLLAGHPKVEAIASACGA